MTFKLEINTDSPVFEEDWGTEVARVLQEVATQVKRYDAGCGLVFGSAYDRTRGLVGRWQGNSPDLSQVAHQRAEEIRRHEARKKAEEEEAATRKRRRARLWG
jgi:hypothetical protein